MDRGDKPDLYYSMFGVWLSKALNLRETLDLFKQCMKNRCITTRNPVDEFALIVINNLLYGENYKAPGIFAIVKILFKRGFYIDTSYRIFLFFLIIERSTWSKRILLPVAKLWLRFYNPDGEGPCTIMAALAYARHRVGLAVIKEAGILLSFFEEGKGFKIFAHIGTGDLLSTAVALFTLKVTGQDRRLVTPSCLELIRNNYESGAFLSGDGSHVRDLEYTFYGLLALGSVL